MIELDETLKTYLIQLLSERFYTITDLEELSKINQIFKVLGYQTESWLSAIQPKQSK